MVLPDVEAVACLGMREGRHDQKEEHPIECRLGGMGTGQYGGALPGTPAANGACEAVDGEEHQRHFDHQAQHQHEGVGGITPHDACPPDCRDGHAERYQKVAPCFAAAAAHGMPEIDLPDSSVGVVHDGFDSLGVGVPDALNLVVSPTAFAGNH